MTPHRHHLRRALAALAIAAAAAGPVACAPGEAPGPDAGSATPAPRDAADQAFPRTIPTVDGAGHPTEVTIGATPRRVVSASVSLTGALLAVDAPVVATGGGGKGPMFTGEEGFGAAWADRARERGVKPLWRLEPDAEAILAEKPDLVVMSNVGQDNATAIYDQIADVVPVVVVDYSDKSWQDVTALLGRATGREAEAEAGIRAYRDRVAEVADAIGDPGQPVDVVSRTPDGMNFFTAESPQGRVFTDLGIEVAQPPADLAGGTAQGRSRGDVVGVAEENLARALRGRSAFVLDPTGTTPAAEVLGRIPALRDAPAVRDGRVHGLPSSAFRIDYFSALELLDALREQLG